MSAFVLVNGFSVFIAGGLVLYGHCENSWQARGIQFSVTGYNWKDWTLKLKIKKTIKQFFFYKNLIHRLCLGSLRLLMLKTGGQKI